MKLASAPTHEPTRAELSRACAALWTATLSLMTAFMLTGAPAHRNLIARRIARNLETLNDQDCFTAETRATFFRLSQRWTHKAELLAGKDHTQGGNGLLRPGCFGH
jgi:hypothetical protein